MVMTSTTGAISSRPTASEATRWGQLIFGIICMVMIANLQYGWTLFVNPIDQKYHYGRAGIQVAFTIFVLMETWLVPFEGYLIDRFGPRIMLIVYGFPRSTFVNIVRLVLTHKNVPYTFHDLEPEMGEPSHLALHPFDRVPILRHDGFTVYETSAIVGYLEDTFPKPALQPKGIRDRALMNQWISSINSYYYPYMIYHITHERLVFPELGIASDEKVVAHALPKVELGLGVVERQLEHGRDYLLGSELTLADFYL